MRTINQTRRIAMSVGLGAALLLGAAGAGGLAELMGPPLICHAISIGDHQSLPWEGGAMNTKKGYDCERLVADLTGLLGGETDVIVRMETLRRAAIYAHEDGDMAWELLGNLALRALDAKESEGDGALALFDTGFVIAVLGQLDSSKIGSPGAAQGLPGYAYVTRAIDAARPSGFPQAGALEYGAALMTMPEMRHGAKRSPGGAGTGDDIYDAHIRAAARGATPGSLLETNLAAHLATWGGSLEIARAAAKTHEGRDVGARQ